MNKGEAGVFSYAEQNIKSTETLVAQQGSAQIFKTAYPKSIKAF
jgi:hypothetical protein